MNRVGRPLVVRRRDIQDDAHPAGGAFASKSVFRVSPPGPISRVLGIFCVDASDRAVALTFDDGPNPVHTPRILDVLARHGVHATFFVLAAQAEKHPELVRRIVAEGHELGLHGMDHRSLLTQGTSEAIAGVRRARATVERLSGTRIRLYRPPYGQATWPQMLRLRLLGLTVVMWSSDALDWAGGSESDVAARGVAEVFPGAILLLHDHRGDPETIAPGESTDAFDRAAVADLILDELSGQGYRMFTVSGLMGSYREVRSAARQDMVAS